jgi:hypothetical protein
VEDNEDNLDDNPFHIDNKKIKQLDNFGSDQSLFKINNKIADPDFEKQAQLLEFDQKLFISNKEALLENDQ